MDELNVLRTKKPKIISIEQYFGEMDLTEMQTEERVRFAIRMRDILMIIFAYAELGDYETAEERLVEEYELLSREFYEPSDDFIKYIAVIATAILDTTRKNSDDEYFFSEDRATYIAENEANTTLNDADADRAIADGKTKKTWHTMRDRKVRHTHQAVDSKTIPIMEYFNVGRVKMRYPKDYENDDTGAETVNCRCTIKYH